MKRTLKALFLLCTFAVMSMCTSCFLFPHHHHERPRHERPRHEKRIKKHRPPKKARRMAPPQHERHHRRK